MSDPGHPRAGDSRVEPVEAARFLPTWATQHPAIPLAALYLYVAAVGFIYSAAYYQVLGLNIFLFSEPSDFFLAPFRHPASLEPAAFFLFFFLLMRAIVLYGPEAEALRAAQRGDWATYYRGKIERINWQLDKASSNRLLAALNLVWLKKRTVASYEKRLAEIEASGVAESTSLYERINDKFERVMVGSNWTFLISSIIAFGFLIFIFYEGAEKQARKLRDPRVATVEVALGDGGEPRTLVLAGSTNRFLVFLDPVADEVLVIPNETVGAVSFESPQP
jgi:hypothetical protein